MDQKQLFLMGIWSSSFVASLLTSPQPLVISNELYIVVVIP